MKIQQIFESRRRPESNPRINPMTILQSYGGSTGGKDSTLFVTMTPVLKVGVNPKNSHGTPYGIYSYPLSYVIAMGQDEDGFPDVPYRRNTEYFTIFRQEGTILDLNKYSNSDLSFDVKLFRSEVLLPFVERIRDKNGEDTPLIIIDRMVSMSMGVSVSVDQFLDFESNSNNVTEDEDIVDYILSNFIKTSKVNTPGGIFWAILYFSSIIISDFESSVDPRNLFRKWCLEVFGFDCITDQDGIIHENEPIQAIHFTTRSIKILETVENNRGLLYKDSQERLIYDGDGLSIRKAVPRKGDTFYKIYGTYYTKEPTHQLRGLEPFHAYNIAKDYDKSLSIEDLQFLHDYSGMELDRLEEFENEILEVIDNGDTESHFFGSHIERVIGNFSDYGDISNFFFTSKLESERFDKIIDNIANAFEEEGFYLTADKFRKNASLNSTFQSLERSFLHIRNNIWDWITNEIKEQVK